MKNQKAGALGAFHKTIKNKRLFAFFAFSILCVFFHINTTYAEQESHEAEFIPWSGYWWPYSQGGLSTGVGYRGYPAPLEKYELLMNGNTPGDLVRWYENRYYVPDAPGWYGLCAYWAWASVYEQYEIFPSSEDNIIFRVGDKKGLLTLAHNNDIVEADDAYRPDVFHYWLLHYIKDQKQAFVVDLEGVDEVWSYPVFGYEMESTKEGIGQESVRVKIYYSNDFVHPDYTGAEVLSKTLTYTLFVNSGAITGGEWTGMSALNYPRKLTIPVSANTDSPYLDYDKVVELARSKDDFLEKGAETVFVTPGRYNLILLDQDHYGINCMSGDTLTIQIEKWSDSQELLEIVVKNSLGVNVKQVVVDDETPFKLILEVQNPPYSISFSQTDYNDPNIYTLKVDIERDTRQDIPHVLNNSQWSGFAVTNTNDEPVKNVMMVAYTADNDPLQTIWGPLDMAGGERKTFLFRNLPWRDHEQSEIAGFYLLSEKEVSFLNLFVNNAGGMAGLGQKPIEKTRIVIPDTTGNMNTSRNVFGEIFNSSFVSAPVTLSLYSDYGRLHRKVVDKISARGKYKIQAGTHPFFSMPDNGWIEVVSNDNQLPLAGYHYMKSGGKAESLFALSSDSDRKFLPHVPEPGYWETSATLINVSDMENEITFHPSVAGSSDADDLDITLAPYEKRTIKLHEDFGRFPGDFLYHSVLEVSAQSSFAGFYTYSTPEDDASFPLLEQNDIKSELILSHYAGSDGNWWTGVGIFNPGVNPIIVSAVPYGKDTLPIETRKIELAPGIYEVFTIKDLLGTSTADSVSFVKFIADDGEEIGGFYLYGNKDNSNLSGSNM